MTGVETSAENGHAKVKVLKGGKSTGRNPLPDTTIAGGIENATTVVVSVKGMIAPGNRVSELEAADPVNTPAVTGVKTSGTGILTTITEGAECPYGREHLAALDCTEIGLHSVGVPTMCGDAPIKNILVSSPIFAPEKPEDTGVATISGDDRTCV